MGGTCRALRQIRGDRGESIRREPSAAHNGRSPAFFKREEAMSTATNMTRQAVHDKIESQIKTAQAKLETLKAKAESAKANAELKIDCGAPDE
jgi:hypothetical protein